jgi:hypothetical protein
MANGLLTCLRLNTIGFVDSSSGILNDGRIMDVTDLGYAVPPLLFLIIFSLLYRRESKAVGYFSLVRAYRTNQKWKPIGKGPIVDYSLRIRPHGEEKVFLPYQAVDAYVVPFPNGILIYHFGMTWLRPQVLIPWNQLRFIDSGTLVVSTPDGVIEIKGVPSQELESYFLNRQEFGSEQ